MRGLVTSVKMTGVVAVTVGMVKVHPLYKKRRRASKKFLARSPEALNVDDEVEITETRPQSRRVSFAVTKVYQRAAVLPEMKEETAEKSRSAKKASEKEIVVGKSSPVKKEGAQRKPKVSSEVR